MYFFGHRDTSEDIRPLLHDILTDLIEKHGADTFYLGNQGGFDNMVREELQKLSEKYPHIRYTIVLAYIPEKRDASDRIDYTYSVYPDGLESVPRRFAIDRCNRIRS